MARYKPFERNGLFIPVVLAEQIQPGTFEFARAHLVDEALDLAALDTKFRNDTTGASAYDPRVMLEILLLAYRRGLITGAGPAQAMLLPMIEQATLRDARTLITADAGHFSDDNIRALHDAAVPALNAGKAMRQRDAWAGLN